MNYTRSSQTKAVEEIVIVVRGEDGHGVSYTITGGNCQLTMWRDITETDDEDGNKVIDATGQNHWSIIGFGEGSPARADPWPR